jgi:hypothetical protein
MKKILLTAFFGYLAVLLTGMLFYRLQIFIPHYHYFQFVTLGFIGAVLYPLFLYLERKESLLAAALLVVFHFIIFKPAGTEYIIRDMLVLASLITSIFLYTEKVIPLIKSKYKILKVFSLALLYGVINIAALFLLLITVYLFFDRWYSSVWELTLLYFRYGFMIGFGLAVGFNFAEFAIQSLSYTKKD